MNELGARNDVKGKGRATDLDEEFPRSNSTAIVPPSPVEVVEPTSTVMASYHSEIPDLALPLPSIPTPIPEVTAGTIAAQARRRLSLFSSPSFSATASPRTRFDLSSPIIHPSQPSTVVPLKPILNPPNAPHPKPIVYETDFVERRDGEVHPERLVVEEKRVPHPMYTPVDPARRRRRRKARSIASGRTSRSGRSGRSSRKGAAGFVKGAWKSIKRKSIRRFDTKSSIGHSSGSSSTDTSRSDGSHSTWNGWRFWKNSSSGSSSDSSAPSEEEWEAPMPHFTLLTPSLSAPFSEHYPSHLMKGRKQSSNLTGIAADKAFDVSGGTTIAPVLERLQAFWNDRKNGDSVPPSPPTETSFFPHANASLAPTPIVTPAVTPGLGKKLTKEEKAALAEKRRGATEGGSEDGRIGSGAAWWLDIMCPTVADLRELRKILPLHPLTMEDIIHQETREKVETFPSLGYYFIVFRALDESYFKYTSPNTVPANMENVSRAGEESGKRFGRGRVDIVEGVGGKEGVEGVGVGAVNLYLVVFRDGILSFHFEDTSKHVDRVQGKLQQFGNTRAMTSDWIAYGLMDSIVDAFFPLIDYIEGESNEVDEFLADPLNAIGIIKAGSQKSLGTALDTTKALEGSFESISEDGSSKKDIDSILVLSERKDSIKLKMGMMKRKSMASVLRLIPAVTVSPLLSKVLPPSWTKRSRAPVELVDASGFIVPILTDQEDSEMEEHPHTIRTNVSLINPAVDRAKMLKRIADMRKLVTGLSRLMGPKADVVRGLRKRTKDAGARGGDNSHDITIYIGDLLDHSIAMQQSLNFYDAILSHDHLAYLGILRLSLGRAKGGIDFALVKLYIVTLTILPINILVGLFSLNVQEPCDGARLTHLNEDGTLAGFTMFYEILGGAILIAFAVWTLVWWIFRSSQKAMIKKRKMKVE